MKKIIKCFVVIALGISFVLPGATVSSKSISTDAASNGWNTGTENKIDTTANPVPDDYQLFGQGVTIASPAKICHEFRMGQYHWVAQIHRLVNGKWVKIPTTQGFDPTPEGAYVACAQANVGGTYALFAYYAGPSAGASTPEPSPVCDVNPFSIPGYTVSYIGEGYDYQYNFDLVGIDVDTLPQTYTFTILGYDPSTSYIWQPYTSKTYHFYDSFIFRVQSDDPDIDPITLRVETDTCHFDLVLNEIVD